MKVASQSKLMSSYHISSGRHFSRTFTYTPAKFNKVATKAMSETTDKGVASGLPIDLKGRKIVLYIFYFACLKLHFVFLSFHNP